MLAFSSFVKSGVIVEAEGDREKVFARGPRWVSFNSAVSVVSDPILLAIAVNFAQKCSRHLCEAFAIRPGVRCNGAMELIWG